MSIERLTLSVGDREVLPVRAIPYVTGWDISPDEVARSLARKIRGGFPNRLENVVAFHRGQDAQNEILPKEWDSIHVRLKSLEAQSRKCFQNDDEGYSEWRNQSVEELPPGVFDYRDDFERAYQGTPPLRLEKRLGDDEVNYSPMLIAVVVEMVLEGFDAERYAAHVAAKTSAGRYTIRDAAHVLEDEAGERFDAILRRLKKAAEAFELPMHDPGEGLRRDYGDEHTKKLRDFSEEAYWDDLNKWLENHEPRIAYKFPAPSNVDATTIVASPHANSTPRTTKATKRDLVWPVIDTAILNAGSEDTAAVWLELKELALKEEPPFDGDVVNDVLKYTEGEKKKEFSRKKLGDRLRRLRIRQPKAR